MKVKLERMLKEKSRVDWLKFGDLTQDFSMQPLRKLIPGRLITALKSDDGSWCHDTTSLK